MVKTKTALGLRGENDCFSTQSHMTNLDITRQALTEEMLAEKLQKKS